MTFPWRAERVFGAAKVPWREACGAYGRGARFWRERVVSKSLARLWGLLGEAVLDPFLVENLGAGGEGPLAVGGLPCGAPWSLAEFLLVRP